MLALMSKDVIITMKRQGRNGYFPTYSLTIYDDGEVMYEGIKNVQTMGTHISIISRPTLDQMVYEFINIYYFALKDRYYNPKSDSCPIVITSIKMDDKSKSIYHEHGSQAPKKISELEDKIDKIVNSKQWTGMS